MDEWEKEHLKKSSALTPDTGYNPEKKGFQIVGIIFMILAMITYAIYIISTTFIPELIPDDGIRWAMLGAIVVFIIGGALFMEYAKRKKYGSQKLAKIGDILSWGIVILLVIAMIVRFFVK